jgi:hyaluronoglucosaminidase
MGSSPFARRGVIEGYYGPPYSHEDRLWWLERLGRWGMNLYVHAPKDDRLQREDWRAPYSDERLRDFSELVERGARAGVQVGFAISPGLSMKYSSREDLACLLGKLRRFRELGVRFFSLGLDDVPSELTHAEDRLAFASLAEAHVAVAHALRDGLGPEACLWLVPTDYVGTGPTDYLETLGERLDPAIEVAWTGRTVVSPSIRVDEAARRAATLGRRLLVWDNVPVADGPMRPVLHLGPYVGRDPGLAKHVSGVLLNPMQHAHASAVCVRTAADYLRDPARYDPERSWDDALAELGEGAEGAFAVFAAAHRFSALLPHDRDPELEEAVGLLRGTRLGTGEEREALARVRALLATREEASERIRRDLRDRTLARELEPWLVAHHQETRRMQAAVEFLERLAGEGPRLAKATGFFAFQSRLERTPPSAVASYGPRRAVYPQLASLRDREARFGDDRALFLDCCLADELVRLAEERTSGSLGLVGSGDPARSVEPQSSRLWPER